MNNIFYFLKSYLEQKDLEKLLRIENAYLHSFIAHYVQLLKPSRVFVCSDDPRDIKFVRDESLRKGEEKILATPGHTIHFDNYYDQARDKTHTKILLPRGKSLGREILTEDRETGLREIHDLMDGIMQGKDLYVKFFCLGPTHSEFSVPCVQLTDSAYVAHTEDILYRQGYEEFLRQGPRARFFKFVHSQGELDENKTSKNLDKRRIYIDLADEIVFSVNTQYGGNSIGLKKLAMRLAIHRGYREGWLTEHMLVMAIHGSNGRKTYFTGAYPSMCGKTSTAMMEGETIVGDDIAFLRKKNGEIRAVNVEKGVFGIIQGVNKKDDPIQWEALHKPNEIIFSNVLVLPSGEVYWNGKDDNIPKEGYNHSGKWFLGKKDAEGNEIPPSQPNARFTISLEAMKNLDPALNDPEGVPVGGIVYGGRDTDTSVPVEESFGWVHGIVTKGASLESETTAATLGKEGVRRFNPMSNLDFLSITVGKYVQSNLDFANDLKNPPKIFSVNYFLKVKNGQFLNSKNHKRVWFKWMELRVNDEVDAIPTPTGLIPFYQDLRILFRQIMNEEFCEADYEKQFTIRVNENLNKIERVEQIYLTQVTDTPVVVFEVLEQQRQRLLQAREMYGPYILPKSFQ